MPTETLMMKISKNTWYGNIPTDWVINKYKFICKISSGDAMAPEDLDDSCEYEVYGGGKLIGFANSYNTQNCILIGRVGANCGCITNISDKCWATDNALILKTSSNKNYMNYLLMASNLNDINESNAQPLITASKVLNFKIPFTCNINEQQAIADFLDEKCEKIDKVIGEIEEQIQILENYKKSLITETVTKGLDKNVPMKDSGIDWIGKIPGNWQIKKIKYLFKVINGSTPDSDYLDYWDGDITWITPADMPDFGYISKGERSITLKGYKSCGTTLVPFNSIVLSSRAPIGKINITEDTLCTNQGCKCLVSNNLCNKYYYYFLYSQKEQLIDAGRGTTFIELSTYSLSNFYALLPPIKIQEQIAGYLDKECTKIDKTINDKKEQLETIKEYKKSLIYEYVTGKKRVAC